MEYDSSAVKLSIVICTHNRYDVLPIAIQSIQNQEIDARLYELIVVDNSPPSQEKSDFFDAIDIQCNGRYLSEDKAGLSHARNLGTMEAYGDFIAFLDDDAIASTSWAGNILNNFLKEEDIGVVGGPVRPLWPKDRPSWLHPWHEGFLTILDRGETVKELSRDEWLAGTNIAFRKNDLVAVGGFDTTIGRMGKILLSNEELVITSKIRDLGRKIIYDPHIEVEHRVHADRISQEWLRRRSSWQAVSDLIANEHNDDSALRDAARAIEIFFHSLPIRERRIQSLFKEMKSKDDFANQLAAVQGITKILLHRSATWDT